MAKRILKKIKSQYLAFALGAASLIQGTKAAGVPAALQPAGVPAAGATTAVDPDEKLLVMLENFEDFRPVKYKDGVYIDPKTHKVLPGESIYFGHQLRPGEILPNYTREQAVDLLREDIAKKKKEVTDWAARNHVTLTPCQIDGLAALVFNVGRGALNGTVGRKIIAGDMAGAADAFLLWHKMHVDGKLVASAYQLGRRYGDRALFLANWAEVNERIAWADKHNHGQKAAPKKTR